MPLGDIAAPFNRGKLANGTTENRGGESTLGNLVAEVQRWATPAPVAVAPQIGFMNPGGLRQDMVGNRQRLPASADLPTGRRSCSRSPTRLVNVDLTGAQIKSALEQQWQPAGSMPTPRSCKLGLSEGLHLHLRPGRRPRAHRIKEMWLNGQAIGADHDLLRDRELVPRLGR